MRDKKSTEDAASPEEKALEQRVDAMMRPTPADAPTPIDIFQDAKTAPAVPKDLLKAINGDRITVKIAASEPSPATSAPVPPEQASLPKPPASANLEDSTVDKAVDEIAAQESDDLLAHEDAATKPGNGMVVSKTPFKERLRHLFKNKWIWLGLGVVLVVIFGLPFTRYKLLGLVIKKNFAITVIDSKTNTAVSSAEVTLAGHQAKTDANGRVQLRVPVGSANLQVTKRYYKTDSESVFVGFKATSPQVIKLLATGRQVPVKVLNSITGQPLADVELSVLHTTAKTDKNGLATIVLPTSQASDPASLSASGYNTSQVTITVTSTLGTLNTFSITPAGKVYFLSNLSGKIDVVKANLDGSGRQVVLAGTGKEDGASTSLLAARDWSFLVLKARRDTGQPALYLIDTSSDKITQFDSGDASFTLVGWYGHNFVYDVLRNSAQQWQAGREILKSYNADAGALNQLDQNQAEGSSSSYAYQSFGNFYILDNVVVYTTQWYSYTLGGSYDLSSKNDTVRGVQPGGQNKKDYQAWPASGLGYIQAALYQPQVIYYAVYTNSDNKTSYYSFTNQAVSPATIDQTSFSQPYPTYLISPSGAQTFWTELRDGKNTLFTGDKNAQGGHQLATLSDYSPYGWFTDGYLLVSKNSSELYIIPASGLSTNQPPLKVTDYYKPATNYNGYGYGYGGL